VTFTATLAGKTLKKSMAKGCLQHSILSPLLLSLAVYQFIEGFNENSCYTVGYTDDIVTLICRKFRNITELLQVALSMVYKSGVLELSYQFTKDGDNPTYQKEVFKGPREPTLSGHTLQLTTLGLFWTGD
jgi:hypothetical protein